MLVLRVDELLPRAVAVPPHDAVEVRVELQLVLIQVVEQLVRAQHLSIGQEREKGDGGGGQSFASHLLKKNTTLGILSSWSPPSWRKNQTDSIM